MTPTIILHEGVRICPSANAGESRLGAYGLTYHKLVKTTPNPRATKKSNGELVGLLLLV